MYGKVKIDNASKLASFLMILAVLVSAMVVMFVLHAGTDDSSALVDETGGDDDGSSDDSLEDVVWDWNPDTNTLKINSGHMPDYGQGGAPWYSYATTMVNVVINENVNNIGKYAFYGCTALTNVDFGGVTKIGAHAFDGCSALASVNIPSIETISDYTFSGCTGLTSVTIPDSVKTIGNYAFKKCQFTTLTLGNELTTIGEGAFENCIGLTSVTIPDSVKTIGNYAFANCTALEDIILEVEKGKVETIGDSAFSRCEKLTSVTIPDSVTEIGDKAFENCSELTDLNLGDKVETIGDYAFSRCGKLGSVTIPYSVTEIGNYAFLACSSLSELTLDEGNDLSIGTYAFNTCEKLTSVTIPKHVNEIGYRAFGNCTALSSVVINSNNASLGAELFKDCPNLTDLTIPISLNATGDVDNPAFEGCTTIANITFTVGGGDWYGYTSGERSQTPWNLTEADLTVKIADEVTKIRNSVFSRCANLTSVDLGKVETIETNAFYLCEKLGSVTIPDSVTTIGYGVFIGCTAITTVIISNQLKEIEAQAFQGCTNLTTLTIGTKVESIDNSAFQNCESLTSVTIPESVTTIGGYAFADCLSLSELDLGKNVKTIYFYAFGNCSKLTSVSIPDSVTEIENYAFTNCTKLSELDLGTSVRSIGDGAFQFCAALTSVTIPESVTTIGNSAFVRCTALESLVINSNNATLGTGAFSGCTDLTDLTIPINLNAVGSNDSPVFSGCTKIANITFTAGTGEWYVYSLVPSQDSYYKNTPWNSTDADLTVNLSSGIEKIGPYAFYGCTPLHELDFEGTGIGFIDDSAFEGCSSLTSVTIPDSVTKIGKAAFADCESLTELHIGNSVVTIGDYAFSKCEKLASITIPVSVTEIGTSAFQGCSLLTKVVIPDSVTSMGASVFSNCSSLATADIGRSVAKLDEGAFGYCTALTYVTMWDCTAIDDNAFVGCGEFELNIKPVICTITFKNGEKVLQVLEVPYGERPEYTGDKPTKESTPQYTFEFKGWDPTVVVATAHTTYNAVFDKTLREYTITFMNGDQILQQTKVPYGTIPEYKGDKPTKESTAQYAYEFKGWDSDVVAVTGDATYNAVFEETLRTYTVSFVNGNQILQKITVPYGDTPVYSGPVPTKADTDRHTYLFAGWGPKIIPVVEDTTYGAVFADYDESAKIVTIEAGDYDSITVTKDAIGKINSDLDRGTVKTLTVELSSGSITLDPRAASKIKGDSEFSMIREDQPVIPSGAQKLIGDRPVYGISIVSADGSIHQFDGNLTVSVKYELRDGEDAKDICIVYLKDNGTYSTVDATYSDGYVTFAADHLSSYAVGINKTDTHSDLPVDAILGVVLGVIIILGISTIYWRYSKREC